MPYIVFYSNRIEKMARSIVEANLLVLDVSHSVATKNKDELQSFFEKSCVCIMKIIERKIFSRPTDLVGIILSGCDETNNNLANADTDEYQNISVCTNLQVPTWDLMELVKNNVRVDWIVNFDLPSNTMLFFITD